MSLHHDIVNSRRTRAASIHRLACRCDRCTGPRRPDHVQIVAPTIIRSTRRGSPDELRGDLMALGWGTAAGILLGALLCLYKFGI